jgi:hypothetical protein
MKRICGVNVIERRSMRGITLKGSLMVLVAVVVVNVNLVLRLVSSGRLVPRRFHAGTESWMPELLK